MKTLKNDFNLEIVPVENINEAIDNELKATAMTASKNTAEDKMISLTVINLL